MARAKLKVGSTNTLEIAELKNTVTGDYPTDATITADLLDATETPVSGASGISVAHVSGTSGESTLYQGTLLHTVALTAGADYTARFTITAGSNVRRIDLPCIAESD